MGIIFTTHGWTGASALVTTDDGVEAFDVAGDFRNAYDVVREFVSWATDLARPWAGLTLELEVEPSDAEDGRCEFFVVSSANFKVEGNAAWRERMCVHVWGEDLDGTMRGSCSAIPGTTMWEHWDVDRASRNRKTPWRTGHPTLSHRRPSCELALDLVQALAFGEAVELARDPRTAYLLDEARDVWRLASVGKHNLQAHKTDDVTKVVGTLELLGTV